MGWEEMRGRGEGRRREEEGQAQGRRHLRAVLGANALAFGDQSLVLEAALPSVDLELALELVLGLVARRILVVPHLRGRMRRR
jgi:hypothetical protein